MPDFKLPGLTLQTDGDYSGDNENIPLGQLLDTQQEQYGDAALCGWRTAASDTTLVDSARQHAAMLAEGAQELLLIGMGGSANPARAVYRALELGGSVLRAVEFMDNPDPLSMIGTLELIDPEQTAVLAVSRSGSTVETLAMLAAVLQHVQAGSAADDTPAVAACCLAGDNPLGELADASNWMRIELPAHTGGRFSAFAPNTLVPLAFSGIDIAAYCGGAAACARMLEELPTEENPAWQLSGMLLQDGLASAVLYHYADVLSGFADWWKQLIGESTGRSLAGGGNAGLAPISARGASDQHSINQLLLDGPLNYSCIFLHPEEVISDLSINRSNAFLPDGFEQLRGLRMGRMMDDSLAGTLGALRERGASCALISLERLSAEAMGSLLQLWHYTTACLGIRLGINPYDQPAVERSKRITDGLLRNSG